MVCISGAGVLADVVVSAPSDPSVASLVVESVDGAGVDAVVVVVAGAAPVVSALVVVRISGAGVLAVVVVPPELSETISTLETVLATLFVVKSLLVVVDKEDVLAGTVPLFGGGGWRWMAYDKVKGIAQLPPSVRPAAVDELQHPPVLPSSSTPQNERYVRASPSCPSSRGHPLSDPPLWLLSE